MKQKDHWEQVYQRQPVNELGWFEESPDPSLELIEACGLPEEPNRQQHAYYICRPRWDPSGRLIDTFGECHDREQQVLPS